ncbi:MAG: hypothetical protein KBD78_11580 [Oligoflexales bacterium]|nr:hypothetical protein [Oligoflexales bacterium]
MSQVVVEEDKYTKARKKTLTQEHGIDSSSFRKKWLRSDATKTTMIERLIGIAVLPILALWTLMTLIAGLVFRIIAGVLKFSSQFVRRSRGSK